MCTQKASFIEISNQGVHILAEDLTISNFLFDISTRQGVLVDFGLAEVLFLSRQYLNFSTKIHQMRNGVLAPWQ